MSAFQLALTCNNCLIAPFFCRGASLWQKPGDSEHAGSKQTAANVGCGDSMKIVDQQDWIPEMILMLGTNGQISKEPGDACTYSCVHAYRLNIVLQLFFFFLSVSPASFCALFTLLNNLNSVNTCCFLMQSHVLIVSINNQEMTTTWCHLFNHDHRTQILCFQYNKSIFVNNFLYISFTTANIYFLISLHATV